MCGICGFVNAEGRPADRATIEAMTATLRRRGPDDAGYYVGGPAALGMRRLSIIDLDTGRQPIANEMQTAWVILNGEIYNYGELRRELETRGHVFRTRSDTEVIVHLYEELGERCVERLNGMFAIAVWDEPRQRLFLARDRMGQKPLYWTRVGAGLAFASEPKSLLAHPAVPCELDRRSLCRYLLYEYVPAPASIFAGIQKLERAHRLIYENGSVRQEAYWDAFGASDAVPASLDEAAGEFWERFRESVRSQLVSDVPLGVFLSGGIDSAAVVAAMRDWLPPDRIETFTIGFEDSTYDEVPFARAVAGYFGTRHREETFSVDRMLEVLPDVADYLDEPFGDASVLPTYMLSRFARQYVTVALGGDGGDELLAGYPTFLADRAAALFRRLPRRLQHAIEGVAGWLPVRHGNFSFDFKVRQFLRGAARPPLLAHQLWIGSFHAAEQRALLSGELRAECDGFDPEAEHLRLCERLPGDDLVAQLTALYSKTYLAEDILTKADRASMAASLEVRAPFLDPGLVQFLTRLPSDWKLHGRETKRVLRRALRGRVPDVVLRRTKKGFGIPVARWLCGPLRELAGDVLGESRLRAQGWFDPAAVRRLLDEHWAGRHNHRKGLWTLIMFQLWHDAYGSTRARHGHSPADPAAGQGSRQLDDTRCHP
jgi:asparagine synthase (glutamine-hydrolysing)